MIGLLKNVNSLARSKSTFLRWVKEGLLPDAEANTGGVGGSLAKTNSRHQELKYRPKADGTKKRSPS